jgi:S-adenosylmethionine decarboxylase
MSGCEWLIEAHGCDPSSLADAGRLRALFDRLIQALDLHPVQEASFHQFPDPGGITGFSLLAESHVAVHTFPEYGSLCLNIFCCRERPDCAFDACLKETFGAKTVAVRKVERRYL